MTSVQPKLRQHTRKRRALQPLWSAFEACGPMMEAERVILAVSGGADSAAMMEAFARWQNRLSFDVVEVVSIDHRTHAHASSVAKRVCARAQVLGFDTATALSLAPPPSVDEGTLRDKRYSALLKHASWAPLSTVILMAHHADDVADGAVLSLLGLSAAVRPMPAARPLGLKIVLARPFLHLSRRTLAAALSACQAPPVAFDPADQAEGNHRARLKRVVRPALEALQPRLSETVRRRLSREGRPSEDPDGEST